MDFARKTLLTLSAFGAAVFLFFLIILSADPARLEAKLKEFAIETVKTETTEFAQTKGITLPDTLGDSELQNRLAERFTQRGETLKAALDAKVDVFVADILANACSLDCERRDDIRSTVRNLITETSERYLGGAKTLQEFAKDRYDATIRSLHSDLIIVSFSNLIVFLFIILLTFKQPRFMPILVKLGALAFISVIVMIYWYVFGQDWITTIIFNAYVGWAYAGFMGVLFLSLCDLAFNEGRILNAIFSSVGNFSITC
jgi:hypothetical protein